MTNPILLSLLNVSWLRSFINNMFQHKRRLVFHTKPILLAFASISFMVFSTLFSFAQLIPLNNFQHSLFAQASQELERKVDVSEMKKSEQKKMMEMKEKKEYKHEKSIRVLDPPGFYKSEENRLYSGPQPGEKLPPLMVTNLYGDNDGKPFDITAETNGKPLILFLQDNSVAGVKGGATVVDVLLKINHYHKMKSNADETEISKTGLQIGFVFLLDEANVLPEWSDKFLRKLEDDDVKVCQSPDGREGPGSYGLNRNVAQTILIAKDGKVLHNFAFTEPGFYTDPHVLGAVAQAIEVEPVALEKWLNKHSEVDKKEEVQKYQEKVAELNEKLNALKERYIVASYKVIREAVINEQISKNEAAEQLRKLGITWEEGEALLKDNSDTNRKIEGDSSPAKRMEREGDNRDSPEGRMQREGKRDPSPEERIRRDGDRRDSPEGRQMERDGQRDLSPEELVKRFDKDGDGKLNEAERLTVRRTLGNREGQNRQQRRKIEVKNPDDFKKNREKVVFSGPQPKEKLPPLKAIAINGDAKGKTIDFITRSDEKPLVLILQDERPLGLRGLVGFTRLIAKINSKSKQQIRLRVLFLGDSPDTIAQQASKIVPHIPDNVLLGVSPDGREGPGNYGLNRNVAQTILTVKDGIVLHNFALAQPMLSPDPYVLGGVGELIGQKPDTLQNWLNETPAEDKRMERMKESSKDADNEDR